jgi:predicted nucleic acid-binding protein
MYLIDSSIYIDTIREGNDPVNAFKNEFDMGMLFSCGVIACEVLRGIRDRQVFERLETFFELLNQVDFDEGLWIEAYNLAWRLDRKGFVLPLSDILIASAALQKNLILITADSHFEKVPDLHIRNSI